MPVSEFGKALLRGMDWKEGDPVGRNKKNKAMEVLEFIPRDSRLGLGAKPSAITAGKKRKHTNQGRPCFPFVVRQMQTHFDCCSVKYLHCFGAVYYS